MGAIRERTTGKGKTVYDAEVRRQGQRSLYKSFARITDARMWVQDMESGMRSGRQFAQTEAQRHTLAEAIDRFILDELPRKPKVLKDQLRHIMWFRKQVGSKYLVEITPALLTQLKGQFLRGVTRFKQLRRPQTWNRYLSSISCVLQFCAQEWEWMEFNPVRRVRREKEAAGRVRFLTPEERERLLEACMSSASPNLYPMVVLALSTGMRRSEVLRLSWDQIDLATGVLILSKTKNGDSRRVPIRGRALELLRQHSKVRRIDTILVFPGETPSTRNAPFSLDNFWYRALKKASISDFRFHDLRHSTASYLAMNGASLLEIAEVLGHKTLQMVKRYSHLAESHTAGVVERMNIKIFGAA
jgi:integrase